MVSDGSNDKKLEITVPNCGDREARNVTVDLYAKADESKPWENIGNSHIPIIGVRKYGKAVLTLPHRKDLFTGNVLLKYKLRSSPISKETSLKDNETVFSLDFSNSLNQIGQYVPQPIAPKMNRAKFEVMPDKDCLFYAPFDENTNASFSQGDAKNIMDIGQLSLSEEGYMGHCLKYGARFWSKKNIDFDKGTIRLAFKHDSSKAKSPFLVKIWYTPVINIRIGSDSITTEFRPDKDTGIKVVSTPESLVDKQWYNLRVSWDTKFPGENNFRAEVYLDGKLIGSGMGTGQFEPDLSNADNGLINIGDNVDELLISQKVLFSK